METAKAVIVAANRESRRQAMDAGRHNAAEAMRPQAGSPSLKQLVIDWNARDK